MSQRTGRLTRGAALLAALGLVLSMASTELAVAKTTKKKTTKKKATATATKKVVKTTKQPDAGKAVDKGTVKIGILGTSINQSTGAKSINETGKMADAWAKLANAQGGINGYKIETVFRDTASDTARALSAVKELDKAGVLAIAGHFAQTQMSALISTIEKDKLPLIGGPTTFLESDTSPMFFHTGANQFSSTMGTAASLRDAGATNVRVVYCIEVARCSEIPPKIITAFKSLGGKDGSQASASATGAEFTSYCVSAKRDGIDAVVLAVVPVAAFIRDCQRQNYHPLYLASGVAGTKALLGDLQGERYTSSMSEAPIFYDGPELDGYRKARALTDITADIASQASMQTWNGLEMTRAILNKMDKPNPTRADFLEAAYTIKGETLGGLLPPQGVDYTGMKDGSKHSSIDCWIQWGLFDGEFKITDKAGQPTKGLAWQCGSIFYK